MASVHAALYLLPGPILLILVAILHRMANTAIEAARGHGPAWARGSTRAVVVAVPLIGLTLLGLGVALAAVVFHAPA